MNWSPMVVHLFIYLVIIFQDTGSHRELTYLKINYIITGPVIEYSYQKLNKLLKVGIKLGLAFFLNLSAIVSWIFLKDGIDGGFFL